MGILVGIKSLLSLNLYARLAMVAAAVTAIWWTDRTWYGHKREKAGVEKAEKQIGKANEKAVSASNRARHKSSTPSVRRGERDPNSTDG